LIRTDQEEFRGFRAASSLDYKIDRTQFRPRPQKRCPNRGNIQNVTFYSTQSGILLIGRIEPTQSFGVRRSLPFYFCPQITWSAT